MPDITAGNPCQEHPLRPEGGGPLHHRPDPAARGEEKEIRLQTIDEMVEAIRALRVRGPRPSASAPPTACMCWPSPSGPRTVPRFLKRLSDYGQQLDAARPTAVNLGWAIREMMRTALEHVHDTRGQMLDALYERAVAIHEDDIAKCRAISEYGLSLLKEGDGVLTHCNAGPLATSRYGTAQGPFLLAAERGMHIRVFADETAPCSRAPAQPAHEPPAGRGGRDADLRQHGLHCHEERLGPGLLRGLRPGGRQRRHRQQDRYLRRGDSG